MRALQPFVLRWHVRGWQERTVFKEGGRTVKRVFLLQFEFVQRVEEPRHSEACQSVVGYHLNLARFDLDIFERLGARRG
ncbi:hypothetical protein D9M72_642880 [compost metagenome]